MKIVGFGVLLITQLSSGVIYKLNASEYARLPALFGLDRFSHCLLAPGDTYCYVDAKLVANETSQLLTVIQEYSAYDRTHFDHTLVHRGLCVTQTCRDHLSTNLARSIEACMNTTLYRTHGLQTRVIESNIWCTKYNEPAGYDAADYATALLGLALLVLNVVGSLLDYFPHGDGKIAGRLLACFSARRNWRRLRMASGEGAEPRLARLKCFTGLKTITTVLVIMAHSPLNCIIAPNNPEYVENMYYNVAATFLMNGTLIIQTFFAISGFLLAYNMLLLGEKYKISWTMLPKGIVFRWLRLAPVNVVVLAFVSTWQRHLGSGPLWKSLVEVETLQCRRDWFYNLLYVNNYVDNSDCLRHTWYLGADMQLSVLGLLIFCLATSPRVREMAVAGAFVVGLLTPPIHTYLQDLSPILMVSPEAARNLFVKDPTFNNLYKRGHTNLICYTIGLALAFLVYRLQKQNFNLEKYKEYTEYTRKHFNHTMVHRALCVRKTCKDFIGNRSLEKEADLRSVLEECVDDEMWKGYKLNARRPRSSITTNCLHNKTKQKYRPLYWSILPLIIFLVMSGCVLYIDGVQLPLAVRAVYSGVIKLAYGIALAALIGGAIFEFENVYRDVLEWRGWALPGRLSYAAYLVHLTVIRTAIGASATLAHNSLNQIILSFLGVLCVSYLIAVLLWMTVEAPFGELIKHCCYPHEAAEKIETVPTTTETYIENKEIIIFKL